MCDCIKQGQADQKGALLFTRNMGKGLHKVFKSVVNEISQPLSIRGKSESELSYFIPKPRKFAEVTRFSEYMKQETEITRSEDSLQRY